MHIKRLLTVLLLQVCPMYADSMPIKLIIHMDINKTIIAHDIANDKMIDHVIIESLAKQYKGFWHASLPEEITYLDYVKQYLVPGDKSDKVIRKARSKATQSFLDVLQEGKDPRYPAIFHRFIAIKEKIHAQKGHIFESFYKLITYLENKGLSYAIVLRTFGEDLSMIADEISLHTPLKFEWSGCFNDGKLHLQSKHGNELVVLDSNESIFNFFKKNSHIQIRDNFKTWNDNRERAEYGKLFPFHPCDQSVKTVFFDDNALENIINARDVQSGDFIAIHGLIENGMACAVDTLQAIEDDDYFIHHLEKNGIV